jgi:hypothetical protein
MQVNAARVRQCLKDFDLAKLFVEELGWDRYGTALEVTTDGCTYSLVPVAHKRGMVAYFAAALQDGNIPDYPTRRKIDHQVTKSAREHLIVYTDAAKTTQVWQWVRREPGKPTACREHTFHRGQPGDALIQKLQTIAFSLEEEAELTLVDVTSRVRAGFDIEKVTKRFYEYFKTEHAAFLEFLKGIPDGDMQRWYVSVMLNRLMFIYFVQKKGFLDGNPNYLRDKLAASKSRGKDRFYREFLCPLFFEGFARREDERSAAANKLLGEVPYLNGGLFLKHQIEEQHGRAIEIADTAFERLFDFFDRYHWHLDERPLRRDDEINPDVLGYIFEKYINQKQMGAYYSKEDITGYISRNTVIPFLFDAAKPKCRIAFEGEQTIWRLLATDPDRYIYPAVRRGVIDDQGEVVPETALPEFVRKGMNDPKARMFNRDYNLGQAVIPGPNGANLALPTETWREYVERRKRCLELRAKLGRGEVHEINDLITLNLDIEQFAQDVIENCEGPETLRAFWHAIAGRIPEKSNETFDPGISILDPTCGSGAFLFAALNILESLYEACLDRMEVFLDELDRSGRKHRPEKFADFRKVLDRVDKHPNRKYFIYKSMVVNNLYGVDIMEEAVEICKLRLFLKLVAQIERPDQIEPLPDIDFNIRAGNTLVGYATYEQVKKAVQSKLDFDNALARIEEKAQDVDRLFGLFRQQQTKLGGTVTAADKQTLRDRLGDLENELNRYLATDYAIDPSKKVAYAAWVNSHKPFHWFVEFYGIMKQGGFDVIIGNPPYVEYSKLAESYSVRGFSTIQANNLYALTCERARHLVSPDGYVGLIVPNSSVSAEKMQSLQETMCVGATVWISSYAWRPSKLFEGANMLLAVWLVHPAEASALFATRYHRWAGPYRPFLFSTMVYLEVTQHRMPFRIPKTSTALALSIHRRCQSASKGHTLLDSVGPGRHRLYYFRAVLYWFKVLVDPPLLEEDGVRKVTGEMKELAFDSAPMRDAALAIMASNLFAMHYVTWSSCQVVNSPDLMFAADLPAMVARHGDVLQRLAEHLMRDVAENSVVQTRKYSARGRSFTMRKQYFFLRKSKPIIDDIDRLLAKYYGLTDEELDFIINYDIKYRLGGNTEDDDE